MFIERTRIHRNLMTKQKKKSIKKNWAPNLWKQRDKFGAFNTLIKSVKSDGGDCFSAICQ